MSSRSKASADTRRNGAAPPAGRREVERPIERPVERPAVYSREDVIAAAAALGVRPEIVAGALRLVGKDELTREEIDEAIQRYLRMGV